MRKRSMFARGSTSVQSLCGRWLVRTGRSPCGGLRVRVPHQIKHVRDVEVGVVVEGDGRWPFALGMGYFEAVDAWRSGVDFKRC
jgi:hypothetical protein